MNYFQNNKLKIVLWIIVVLLVINISALATLLLHQNKETQECPYPEKQRREGQFIKKELQLDDAQFEQFKALRHKFRQSNKTTVDSIHLYKNLFFNEMTKNNYDTAKLLLYSEKISQFQNGMLLRSAHHYHELSKICTPEQKEKLSRLYKNIIFRNFPQIPSKEKSSHSNCNSR